VVGNGIDQLKITFREMLRLPAEKVHYPQAFTSDLYRNDKGSAKAGSEHGFVTGHFFVNGIVAMASNHHGFARFNSPSQTPAPDPYFLTMNTSEGIPWGLQEPTPLRLPAADKYARHR
jgi:hypothetical protein